MCTTENCNIKFLCGQEAHWSMASALSEADGIDYTDPEEVGIPYTCHFVLTIVCVLF